MKRRSFIRDLLGAGASQALAGRPAVAAQPAATAPDQDVKRVLVMFKCHLDVGFVDTQANVIRKYFDVYFPQAIKTAATVRQSRNDRYVWTTGSWLVHEYLKKAPEAPRRQMERAISDGDIAWHAIPFTWQSELLDRSLIAGGLGLSRSLDRRFGRTTTGAKMTDVPGHTRGLIGPLAEHGIKFLDIGVNSASTPPDVPALFVWKDPEGRSLIMMYHHRAYGGVVKVPGSDLAVDVEVRNDNSGPHSLDEIGKIYSRLRRQFPNAKVSAASLTDIANAIVPYSAHLPVITDEIGDTWIYGVPSDPLKVARYREIARLRNDWIAQGKIHAGDETDLKFLSSFLLEVEHTWGTDTKTWLDFDHYTPRDLKSMLDQPKYRVVQSSWAEKRQDLLDAVATLPAPLQAEASGRIQQLQPRPPDTARLRPHSPDAALETAHFVIAMDPHTGAISRLRDKKTGHEWATARQPLALFSYQTLSKDDYDRFFAAYLKSKADWAPKDFGKPGIERSGAQSRTWTPVVDECYASGAAGHRIVARLKISDGEAQQAGRVAWPERMYLELNLPDADPVIEVGFSWLGKPANRMPEALWLSFVPAVSNPRGWLLHKTGALVSPFDVVTGGNRAMHAIDEGVRYRGPEGVLNIASLDAPVVALGERMPVFFTRSQPDLMKGLHFSLFNNGWGTNYIQWFGEDMHFRFRISVTS